MERRGDKVVCLVTRKGNDGCTQARTHSRARAFENWRIVDDIKTIFLFFVMFYQYVCYVSILTELRVNFIYLNHG